MKEKTILVVDDDEQMRIALREALSRGGYQVETACNGYDAVKKYRQGRFDLVITDVKMNGMDGIEVLKTIKRISSELPIVLITAYGTIDNAVEAMKSGAYDYIMKPFSLDELQTTVEKAIQSGLKSQSSSKEVTGAAQRVAREIVHEDARMKAVLELAQNIAGSKATVLIQGESGTGKELLARYVHAHSPRRTKPFVAINCAAIPENLLESELFGHEKGAFTGAIARRSGKFEQADGGTLLLDEVSEMAMSLQAKLLRVLQEFEIDRVGGNEAVPVDVRVVATTNLNLTERMKEGKFREDLFYRLNVIPLYIPPLRERRADIIPLTHYFFSRIHQDTPAAELTLTEEVKRLLVEYEWHGNVRELENTLQRAILLSQGAPIQPQHLFPASQVKASPSTGGVEVGVSVREMEKDLILKTLEAVNDNRTQAAGILGISIRTLRNKLKEYATTTG